MGVLSRRKKEREKGRVPEGLPSSPAPEKGNNRTTSAAAAHGWAVKGRIARPVEGLLPHRKKKGATD